EGRLCRRERAMFSLNLAARARQFSIDLGKSAALREAPGGTRWRVRGGNESIPAPEIAFGRHQALACLQSCSKPDAGVAFDHPDLREPARKLCRCLDVAGQGLDTIRKGGVSR